MLSEASCRTGRWSGMAAGQYHFIQMATKPDPRLTILVHGYNTTKADAGARFRQVAAWAPERPFLGFHWPGAPEYLVARKRAVDAGQSLARLIEKLDCRPNIIGHSMGCRVIMEALARFADDTEFAIKSVGVVCLLAPAVDNDELSEGGQYRRAASRARSIVAFHSHEDSILKWAYPAGDFDRALGYSGAQAGLASPDNLISFDCSDEVTSHAGYYQNATVRKRVLAWLADDPQKFF